MISQEEATAIVETATKAEASASAHLVLLIYGLITPDIPDAYDIPIRLKALAINVVKSISQLESI